MNSDEYPFGDKQTWGALARDIVAGRFEVAKADLPKLLGWLRDMNWPGAHIIAEFLAQNQSLIAPAVGEILRGDDDVWKYWVLTALVPQFHRESVASLSDDLLATAMTDDAEECAAAALKICAANQLGTRQQLAQRLEALKSLGMVDEEDARRIANHLDQRP